MKSGLESGDSTKSDDSTQTKPTTPPAPGLVCHCHGVAEEEKHAPIAVLSPPLRRRTRLPLPPRSPPLQGLTIQPSPLHSHHFIHRFFVYFSIQF